MFLTQWPTQIGDLFVSINETVREKDPTGLLFTKWIRFTFFPLVIHVCVLCLRFFFSVFITFGGVKQVWGDGLKTH